MDIEDWQHAQACKNKAGERKQVIHSGQGGARFGHQKNRYGLFIRTIGLARAEAKLILANLAYNFDRLIFWEKRRTMG